MFVRGTFTRYQWGIIREGFQGLCPTYKEVQKAKKTCYPAGVEVDSTGSSIPLRSVLEHTTQRIFEAMKDEERIPLVDQQEVIVHVKWGMDGCGGLSLFKQKGEGLGQDGSIFVSGFVPLRISSAAPSGVLGDTLWANPKPSSSMWCRPIRFRYTKETAETVRQEREYIKSQFDAISADKSVVVVDGKALRVKYQDYMTMVDGKVANIISDCASAMRCNICNLTIGKFNDQGAVNKAKEETKVRVF